MGVIEMTVAGSVALAFVAAGLGLVLEGVGRVAEGFDVAVSVAMICIGVAATFGGPYAVWHARAILLATP